MNTNGKTRKAAEHLTMAGLMIGVRLALPRHRVQDVLSQTSRVANVLLWTSPFRQNEDTILRGSALAYTWSGRIPGSSCLHRAVSTQLWLAAFRVRSRVVMGLRKRAELEGHAWLEVRSGDASTLLFADDDDGYPSELVLPQRR